MELGVLLAGYQRRLAIYRMTPDRITSDPVHVHDLNATILHFLGIDHEKLTYKFQGRQYRLTDVHGRLVRGILA